MSQQQVTITITAKDGASTTFQAVGKAATGMSSTAQAAARTTNTALGSVATQAGNTERAVGGIGRGFGVVKSAAAGLVGSAVVGFLSDAARAAADSEAVMARLSTAVDAAGGSMVELAPRIEAATAAATQLAFDDEAAASALATLTQQTGDAGQAIDLLSLSMDVARGRGIDLETAANAVGKAAAGNVSALQRMGVVVGEGATASEALALAQQQFAGQADAYAQTTQGAFDRAATAIGNVTEAIGEHLGPAQTLVGLLPGLSSGFSLVSGAATALGGAGGIGSLLAMMNPLGLAVGGVALAVGGLAVALSTMSPEAREAKDALDGLNAALDSQKIDEQTKALIDNGLNAALMQAADVAGINAEAQLNAGQISGEVAEQYRVTGDEIIATQNAVASAAVATGDRVAETAKAFTESLIPAMGNLEISQGGVVKAAEDINTVFAATGPAAALAQSKVAEYVDELNNGERGAGSFAFAVTIARSEMEQTVAAADRLTDAHDHMTTSIVGTREEFGRYITASGERVLADEYAARKAQEAADAEAHAARERAQAASDAAQEIADAAERSGAAQIDRVTEARSVVEEQARRQADAQIAAAEQAESDVVNAAQRMADDQIAAAEAAEQAIVAAAERTANAQVRAANAAARDATRALNLQLREAERAAEMAYNKKTASARRNEEAAKSSAEREYDARVQAAEDASDREIEAIRAKYDGATEERLVREAEARKEAIIADALAARTAAENAAARERTEIERAAQREMLAAQREAQREATQAIREENRKALDAERTAAKAVADAKEQAESASAARIETINQGLEDAKQAAAQETEAIRTAALNRVERVEERTANRIQEIALETARVQAAASEASAVAAEEAAARKIAAEKGVAATVTDTEPLDGPVRGRGSSERPAPSGLRSGVTDATITGTGTTAKAVTLDTQEFDQTMRELEAQIYRFERDPVIATVAANLQKFEAAVGPLRGATIGTVFFDAALGLSTYNQTIASMNGQTVGNQVFTVTPKAVGKTYRLVETSTRSSMSGNGAITPREAFAPAAVAVGAPASMTTVAAPAGGGGGGGGGGGTGEVRFYGPVTFQMANANVADEVRRQLQTRKRS
jgi:hypothetical protein